MIKDFKVGKDLILAPVKGFGQLEIKDVAGGAEVGFKKASVTLKGVEADDLSKSDFHFGDDLWTWE